MDIFDRYPQLKVCENDIDRALSKLIECYEGGGKVLVCGNGGSCADSDHIVGELMKGFLKKRPISAENKQKMLKNRPDLPDDLLDGLQGALPAISLCSLNALNTAFSNDVDPDMIYAQGVYGLGRKNDILICISTSGNAKNVGLAAYVARALGMTVVSLTGRDGGKLREISDISIIVPENETYKIQEMHLPVYHYLCAEIEEHFFKK